ncbi:MAG: thioredoxin family protein [Alphaproteobacteria bacterium]|nr:thioredoxin family protein [Alphaproteobacteria bacterium]
MPITPSEPELGGKAPDIDLPGTDGRNWSFSDLMGTNGLVVVFICNHCPYVKAITDRLVADADTLRAKGVGFVAICANDADHYPEDSFENMGRFARERRFTFPYLHDESQSVARAYDAMCTPDFFGISKAGTIEYRGRLDEGRTSEPPADARRDLVEAMGEIAATGHGPKDQPASVGCSIKWKQV